jgi:hypothetical protein
MRDPVAGNQAGTEELLKMKGKREFPVPKALETLFGMIERLGDKHDPHQVFFDFCEMSACAISNSCDPHRFADREARYLSLVRKYTVLEDRRQFPAMFAELTLALEATERDVLGPISQSLGMTSYRRGQFWTPWEVSRMMARIALSDMKHVIEDNGFFTLCEPACGAGGMVLAAAYVVNQEGFNFQRQMHVHAIDIDPWCVHMTYLQASLIGLPAIVIRGDALSDDWKDFWFTPMHVWRGFSSKLRHNATDADNKAWWAKASVPERIAFLKGSGLTVSHSMQDKAERAVLDAKRQQDDTLKETA